MKLRKQLVIFQIFTGDMAILETMQRMCDAAGEEDIVFRIGADEFVMLTDSKEQNNLQKDRQKENLNLSDS